MMGKRETRRFLFQHRHVHENDWTSWCRVKVHGNEVVQFMESNFIRVNSIRQRVTFTTFFATQKYMNKLVASVKYMVKEVQVHLGANRVLTPHSFHLHRWYHLSCPVCEPHTCCLLGRTVKLPFPVLTVGIPRCCRQSSWFVVGVFWTWQLWSRCLESQRAVCAGLLEASFLRCLLPWLVACF